MAIPLLAVFAAGLGLQAVQQGRERERATVAAQAVITQGRATIATALNQGLIDQKQAAAGDAVAQQGDARQTNTFLRSLITGNRAEEEFAITSAQTAETARSQREERDRRFLLDEEKQDAALNIEFQTALAAGQARGRLDATTDTGIDGASGNAFRVPSRGQPLHTDALKRLRENNRGLDNINRIAELVQGLPAGQTLDPAAPVTTELANRYENLLAFGRKEQNLGTPQAAEIKRQERANPNATSFIRSLSGSKAATLASLTVTQETFQRTSQQQLRDTRNFDFDSADTDRTLDLLAEAHNTIEVSKLEIGSDVNRAFGAGSQSPGAGTVTQARTAIDIAGELLQLTRFPREDTRARLRKLQEVGAEIFGNPDIPLFIPDVLPKRIRELLGTGAETIDIPFSE